MAPKPCPYRKEHEWEWEPARQTWLCSVCYAVCDKPSTALAKPTDDTPTPPHPFPMLTVSPKSHLWCAINGCGAPGQMEKVGPSRWATRCSKHTPRWLWES